MTKKKFVMKKKYDSLYDLRKDIENIGEEKVIEYSGWYLTTNKNRYTIVDSVVYVNGIAAY